MDTEQQAQDAQVESEEQTQEVNEEATPQQEEATPSEEAERQGEEEKVPLSELRKKNREAKNLRDEKKKLEARLKELEDARLGEDEKKDRRLQELEEVLDEYQKKEESWVRERRKSRFIEAINLPSPRLAWNSLADLPIEVEWDEGDRPTNLREVRRALKAEFPREFGDGSADGAERAAPVDDPVASFNQMLRARGRT
jgi:flagellar biosynthesis GTPase FlhF